MSEEYSIYDLGFSKQLNRDSLAANELAWSGLTSDSSTSVGSYTGGLSDLIEDTTNPQNISSGVLATILYSGKTTFSDTTSGYRMGVDSDGVYKWIIGGSTSSIDWSVTTADTLTINGVGIVSPTISYGKTSFSDSTNAGYFLGSAGVYIGAAADATKLKYTVADGTFDLIGTISSRSTATIASAINSAGNLITDLINARIDSSAKTILSDFNFGATNYAGAVKAGDITWNTTTGAITGGSGIVVYRGGIVGANAGTATFSISATTGEATFAGTLSAPTGSIGGFTIGASSLSVVNAGNTVAISSSTNAFIAGPTGSPTVTITQAGAITATSATITGALTTGAGSSLNGTYLTAASVASSKVNAAIRGWSQTCVFSPTDTDTVAWGSGNLILSDGTSYSITASNTGNMAARTYIYFDAAVSTTAYQYTTTAATAVGDGKILVASAINNLGEATFTVFGGVGGMNIDAASIVAGSITANEIAANTITANKMTVAQLSSITADLGAITAGTIVIPSGGFIRSGQTAFDTGTGFYIGNDSSTPKLSLGNSAGNKITWNGTSLSITGSITSTDGTIGGFTLGATTLSATNLTLTSGAANTANIAVGTGSNLAGLNSANASSDIAIWAGDTFANRATAPFRVTAAGDVTMSSATITGKFTGTSSWLPTVSDTLRASADTERSGTYSTPTYAKVKEIEFGVAIFPGTATIRISFDLKAQTGAANDCYGRIYRNGAAVGTLRGTTSSSYITYSEDVSGWAAGDKIQLYISSVAGNITYVRNFRIYYDRTTYEEITVITD